VTTPIRPLPNDVARWTSRLRWLRWADALLAWLALLLGLTVWIPQLPSTTAMILAIGLLVVVSLVSRLRIAWRPVSAMTTLLVSRRLRPGDRAWFVHGRDADLVLVTARHGVRIVVARPDHEAAEGMSIRRTRVLLLPVAV
jgi:hypothetical protein